MAHSDKQQPSSEERIRQARERLQRPQEETQPAETASGRSSGLEPIQGEPDPPGVSERPNTVEEPRPRRDDPRAGSSPTGGDDTEGRAGPRLASGATQPWHRRPVARALGLVAVAIVFQLVRAGVFTSEPPELAVGECFNSAQMASVEAQAELTDVDVVPCDEPHMAEAFASASYPSTPSDTYPGTEMLTDFAAVECAPELAAYIDGDVLGSGFNVMTIVPNNAGWGTGDRTIECALTRLDGQRAVGSAEGSVSIVPEGHVSIFRLREGDCVDGSDWFAFGIPLACDEPHDFEVFAVLTIPAALGAPYSSVEDIASAASASCAGEFARRVDPAARNDLGFAPVAFPLLITWELGHRSYVCGLFAADATKLVGSRLLAHGRHGDLIAAEFGGEPLLVDFDAFSDVGSLDLVGSAHQENQVLALTEFAEHAKRGVPFEEERPQRGAAWFAEAVPVEGGFVTAFVFQFEMYSWFTVGDGLAFVIQGGDTEALGVGIGYDGMPNSLAVEFDTLKEDWLADPKNNVANAPDLLGNHVAVHTRGILANDTHTDASLGWANLEGFYMADRAAHVALIVYQPGELKVYVDDFDTPALTVSVDLAKTLRLDGGKAYVGFTASCGPETSRGPRTSTITGHKILAWELTSQG